MVNLNRANDRQNHLLTQLSYSSHRLKEGLTLTQNYLSLNETEKNSKYGKILREMIDQDLGTLVIKDVGNDSVTGFGAVAFEDHEGNTGISFRGTDGFTLESLNDWGDNIVSGVLGTSVQTAQAEAFFNRNKDIDGKNYLYGHSKGGQLAESVFVNNFNDIKGAHLLNPQPLNPYSLTKEQQKAIQSEKMDIVVVEHGYVWFIGALPSLGNIRFVENTGGGDAHLYSSDRYTDGRINAGQMPVSGALHSAGITVVSEGVQKAFGGTVGYTYNCVVRVVDFAKEDLWPEIKGFINTASSWIAEQQRELKDFSIQLSRFLTNIANDTTEWIKNLNSGYRAAGDNPAIRVDTAKLRSYAGRLLAVNKRLNALDGRMDDLYYKVGLRDLFNLIQADFLTDYSLRISCCATYLEETAKDFDSTERNVADQF